MEETLTNKQEQIYNIEATIFCIRDSHKGIIIGKNGTMLKKIGTYARQDLEKILGIKINLKTWVKVKKDWQDQDTIVKKFKFNQNKKLKKAKDKIKVYKYFLKRR